ncbi:MAG: hypothetical protein RLZZ546_1429 [Bacteroidota bacterium]|jgi:hypothetical protein
MRKIAILTLTSILLFTNSCTSIIENGLQQGLIGDWILVSIEDVATKQVTNISGLTTSTRILNNTACDAIEFAGSEFNAYYQFSGNDGEYDGSYAYDFGVVTMTFDNGRKVITKVISQNGLELKLADTLNNKARVLTFTK